MNMHAMVCRVTRIRSKLAGLLGRDPTASEIAIAARLPESKVESKAGKMPLFCRESLFNRCWIRWAKGRDEEFTLVVIGQECKDVSHKTVSLDTCFARHSPFRTAFGIGIDSSRYRNRFARQAPGTRFESSTFYV